MKAFLLSPLHFLQALVLALLALVIMIAAAAASTIAPAARVPGPPRQAGYLLIDCPPFQNVGASQKATASMDNLIGYTIDRIVLEIGGASATKANLTNIRLVANEKTIFEDSGARTDARMAYRGIAANASYLTIDFSEIRARTIVGQRIGSLDTVSAGIRKLTIEVDIGAAAATPTLRAFAMLSDAPQRNPDNNQIAVTAPLIAKVISKTYNPGAAGEFIFPFEYAKSSGSFVKRIHLFGSTITDARIKKNGLDVFKASDARNDYLQTEFLRTPQANQYTIDWVIDGNMSDALPLQNVKSIEPYVTVSGAGNVIIVNELIDLLSNN